MSEDVEGNHPFFQGKRWIIATGVGAIIIAVSLYAVFFVFNYKTVFSDLTPTEAADIVDVLQQEEIGYRLAADGTEIRVPASKADRVKVSLAGAYAPMRKTVGFELFDDSDMGLTEFAQRIKYQRALQGSLSRTIMMMDSIEDARVHISMPERALFKSEQNEAKAAVTLRIKSPVQRKADIVASVQSLVANSVPELAYRNVVVLDISGRVLTATPAVPPASPIPFEGTVTSEPQQVVNRVEPEHREADANQLETNDAALVQPISKSAELTSAGAAASTFEVGVYTLIGLLCLVFVGLLIKRQVRSDLSNEQRDAFIERLKEQLASSNPQKDLADA